MSKRFSVETELADIIISENNETVTTSNVIFDYILKAGKDIQGAIDAGFFDETELDGKTDGVELLVESIEGALHHLKEGILSE